MTKIEECQELMASARLALFQADLALAERDLPGTTRHLDLAQAYVAEVRKTLPPTFTTTPQK